MNSSLLAAQTGHSHLRRLFLLRCGTLLAQFATLILVHRFLSPDFAWKPMLGAVSFLMLVNLLTWWRLSLNFPVGSLELFLQLSMDVLQLTVLLYYGGGWLQYGFRYALDAIPFAVALCATVLARRRAGLFWWLALAVGLAVNAAGVYWAYHLF